MAGCCCCRLQTYLVWLQMFLGVAITGLCVYLHMFVDVITFRDKPFWAGIPLVLVGVLGTSFIRPSKNLYGPASSCRFSFQVLSLLLALVSMITCLCSVAFSAHYLYKLYSHTHCQHLANGCLCFDGVTQTDGGHLYSPVRDCHVLFCEIKIYIMTSGSLCLLACVCTLCFLVSVWRSAYGHTSCQLDHAPYANPAPFHGRHAGTEVL